MTDKTCTHCGKTKHESEFPWHRKVCNDCYRAAARKRMHKKNPGSEGQLSGAKSKPLIHKSELRSRITPFY